MSLWDKFKYIHSENIQDAFERMVLALYSNMYNVPSKNSFKNHAFIEQNPIYMNGIGVGIQAKCYDKLSDVASKIKKDIPKIALYDGEMKIDKLIYFFSFDISQDLKTLRNKSWHEIVELGKQHGLLIEYWGLSKILKEIDNPHNQFVYEQFFSLEDSEKEVSQYKVTQKWRHNYIDRKIIFDGRERRIDDILDENGIVFLVGDAGVGKSTEIEKICSLYNSKKYNTFKLNLYDYKGENLSSIGITTTSLKSKKSIYLFDGFDDLDIKYVSAFMTVINKLRLNSHVKIIISGRTIHYYDSGFYNEIPIITLKLLSNNDVDIYLKKRLKRDIDEFKSLSRQVDMINYLKIPFYLVKLVDIYISKEFVPNIAKMFEVLFEMDVKKISFNPNRDANLIMNDLMDLSEEMIINGRINYSISELNFVSKEVSLKSGWLTIDENSRLIKFTHKTFLEYLYARKLLGSSLTELIDMVTVTMQKEIYLIPKYSNIVRILSEYSNDFAEKLETKGYNGMINHETSRVSDKKNIERFISIVQRNIELDYWYNEQKYSYEYLADLMDSEEGTIFLLDLLAGTESNVVLHIVTGTLVYNAKKYNEIVVQILLGFIETLEEKNKLNEILKILSNCDIKKEELKKIMENWFKSSDSGLRATFYYIINKNNWEDYFVGYLLEGKKLDSNSIGRSQSGDIYNISEGINLSKCLVNFKRSKSIISLGNYILESTKKRHNDFVSELEKHYINNLKKIENFDDDIKGQFLKFIDVRLTDIYERDYSDILSIINFHGLLTDVLEVLTKSKIYDLRKIEFLAQISSLENIYKIINFVLTNPNLVRFDQSFLAQLKSHNKSKEYEFASKIIIPIESPKPKERTTNQEHFDNLFKTDFLINELKKMFECFDNSFTWEKLMMDYESDFDHDIKMLFQSFKENDEITFATIKEWDIDLITFNLILQKASEKDVAPSEEQIKYISDQVSQNYSDLNCTGISNQHKSGFSQNIYTLQLSKIAYKYETKFPIEFYKLLNYHVTTIEHSFVGIEYLNRYLDLSVLLDINVELINNDFFIFETEFTKRIEFLAENNDYRVKDKLLELISKESSDEVTSAIIKFFETHNRQQVLDNYIEFLSNEALQYYYRDTSCLNDSRYKTIKNYFSKLNDADERKFTLSSILLTRKNFDDYKLFLNLCYKTRRIVLSGYKAVNYIKYIDDITILSDLLVFAIELKDDDFDHTPNMILTQIENYFAKYNSSEQANIMDSELDIIVKTIIDSEVNLANRYLMYVEKMIIGYLNNIV